jgi:hypothetical protein
MTATAHKGKVDAWTHRQAIQIVAQLPDDTDTALAVLARARELLVCWGEREEPKELRPALVRTD